MMIWASISPEQAHREYKIPLNVSSAPENAFWGRYRPPESYGFDMDGPWPIVALTRHERQSNIVTLHIYSLIPEVLEAKGFNPLQSEGGYIYVDQQEFMELPTILENYSKTLTPTENVNKKHFAKLDNSELSSFHLSLNSDSTQQYFRQIEDPIKSPSNEKELTLIQFSLSGSISPKVFFWIGRFQLKALEKESFKPEDHSLPNINLDRAGLIELSFLMKSLFTS